jgi:signal transduction histidine kinase
MQDDRDVIRDPARLEALRDTGLLDTEVEEQFDRLTRLASVLLDVPATFFSLVDEDRDFYKSCFGFPEPLASERQLFGTTFCHYSIVANGALVIPDTRADPVYRTVPTVETLGVAAYLGVPVHAPGGEVLGSFCAIDFQSKQWSGLEIEIMKELAVSAEREVAIRHWMRRQQLLMERELAARGELERVMESRGRLIRGFTHDVKNPLGAAGGFISLLEDEIYGPVSDKQREVIGRVGRSLRTALKLIDDLVDIARSEAGHLETENEAVDLRRVALELVEEYRAQAQAKGLEIRADLPDLLPPVLSDSRRIQQILSNLLANAVKYTRSGGVVVRAEVHSGDSDPRGGGWLAIEVVDTGPGIAEEDFSRMFEEFTRLDPESSPGAGLGLAISERLAHVLGGSIAVKSVLSAGSTFTLLLPLSPAGRAVESPA